MEPIIPKTELSNRIANMQGHLREEEKDALLVPLGVHFNYFFGKQGVPSERIIAGIIPSDDDPFIICPSFEEENLRTRTYIDDIIGWDETVSPYKVLVEELDARAIGQQIIADPKLWIVEKERIEDMGDVTISQGSVILSSLRSRKTEWEITQLKAASKASAEGILETILKIEVGMTELEVVNLLALDLGERSGNPLSFGIVQFGENSAIPHGGPTSRKLSNDEVILIDAGTSVNGYHGDITITVPFGNPTGFDTIYDIVYQANRAALDLDKAGVIPADLDAVARTSITDKGYGDDFTHRLGHGIGLEVHEDPYIVGNNQEPLAIGNCHTIEPGIYQLGKFGVRIEDDVVITENGAELLYKTPRYNFD